MLSPELEKLIDLAVADGEITEQERKVLYKKAYETGADRDEFEMTLEAKLFQTKKDLAAKASVAPATAPKTNSKHGEARKCPGCGAPVSPFSTNCSECGYEFTSVEAVKSASAIFEALQSLERDKAAELAKHNDSKHLALMKLSTNQNHGYISDATEREQERKVMISSLEKAERQIEKKYENAKITLIKTFAVPNTKEDLMELLSMSTSNAYDNDNAVGPEEEAWLQKSDQIYQKILIAAASDTTTLNQATSMIVSLIKRLPYEYRNFTRIPKEMRTQIEKELAAEKAVRKQAVQKIYFGWQGILTIVSVILFFVGGFANWAYVVLLSVLGFLIGLISLIVGVYNAKKDLIYD